MVEARRASGKEASHPARNFIAVQLSDAGIIEARSGGALNDVTHLKQFKAGAKAWVIKTSASQWAALFDRWVGNR